MEPRVSTLGKLRTMAFLAAIFLVPKARHVVITTARPSGIAATANATAILNYSLKGTNNRLHVINSAFESSMMGRIIEVAVVDKPNEDTNDSDYSGKHVTEIVQFLLERCSFRYL